MINWNDIYVEMEIAQERYQPIIQARSLERSQVGGQSKPAHGWRDWLGQQLVKWGQRLQQQSAPTASNSLQGC